MHCAFLSNSFTYANCIALYIFIVLLSYLMLVIYISVPVAHFVRGRGQNIDSRRVEFVSKSSYSS